MYRLRTRRKKTELKINCRKDNKENLKAGAGKDLNHQFRTFSLKKLGVGKRKKVSGGSMLPKLLVAASKLQRAPLPRVRVSLQVPSLSSRLDLPGDQPSS